MRPATAWSIWANSPEPEARNSSLRITQPRSPTALSRHVLVSPCTWRPAALRAQEPKKSLQPDPRPKKSPPRDNPSPAPPAAAVPPRRQRLCTLAGRTVASSRNVLRDLRLLGLVSVDRKKACLRVTASGEAPEFEDSIRPHIREHLRRNRLVVKVLEALQEAKQAGREELPRILKETCTYVSTWLWRGQKRRRK